MYVFLRDRGTQSVDWGRGARWGRAWSRGIYTFSSALSPRNLYVYAASSTPHMAYTI